MLQHYVFTLIMSEHPDLAAFRQQWRVEVQTKKSHQEDEQHHASGAASPQLEASHASAFPPVKAEPRVAAAPRVRDPNIALECFTEAVKKERQGNLGSGR